MTLTRAIAETYVALEAVKDAVLGLTDWTVRTCSRVHGGVCHRDDPCVGCLNARSTALAKTGPDFPALGSLALRGFAENA